MHCSRYLVELYQLQLPTGQQYVPVCLFTTITIWSMYCSRFSVELYQLQSSFVCCTNLSTYYKYHLVYVLFQVLSGIVLVNNNHHLDNVPVLLLTTVTIWTMYQFVHLLQSPFGQCTSSSAYYSHHLDNVPVRLLTTITIWTMYQFFGLLQSPFGQCTNLSTYYSHHLDYDQVLTTNTIWSIQQYWYLLGLCG